MTRHLPDFALWAQQFRQTSAFVWQTSHWRREPVARTLDKIRSTHVSYGTGHQLEQNLIKACYQAKYSQDPAADYAAKERMRWELGVALLRRQEESARALLAFAREHPTLSLGAMGAGQSSLKDRGLAHENWETLLVLTTQYADGLCQLRDVNHKAHWDVVRDFIYGPFAFPHPLTREAVNAKSGGQKRRLPNVRVAGLIFHLALLFRYFTCIRNNKDAPQFPEKNGAIQVQGYMLKVGQPMTHLIAPLVNATFFPQSLDSSFSAEKVRDCLHDLHRSRASKIKNSHTQNRDKRRDIEFIGWNM